MELDAVFAGDMAVLATTSALLHYAMGFKGMVLAFALLAVAENSAALWTALTDRTFQLWHALSTRDSSDGAGTVGCKTLDRQKTWRFARAAPAGRDERTRSDAHTELADDDEVDDISDHLVALGDQLLETNNANETNENNNPVAPPMDRCTQELLAKLSIHDVASSSPSTSPPDRVVAINARTPVPFETDLFVGHALFLVRTSPEDPHFAPLFAGKRRMFWIQVQGRFKQRPLGAVFLGGELPGRISLGLFTKSIARVILGIVQSLMGNVYMSFGGTSNQPNDNETTSNKEVKEEEEELPAVAFPLYQCVDQFMVTPAGETPPPLGTCDFGESDQARAIRRNTPLGTGGDHVFDVGPTYSFHFHTMYVDLAQWKTANLPGLSDMQLATFFDSLPLRLVAYDAGEDTAGAGSSGRHVQQRKQYLFNFEVAFDPQRTLDGRLRRSDSELSLACSSESTSVASTSESTNSTTSGSPFPTVVLGDDQAAIHDALATIDRENARALQSMELTYLFWMEEVDFGMGVRRVQYVFRLRERCGDSDEDEALETTMTERLVVVSAYRLRLLLGSKFRRLRRLYPLQSLGFHTRSRIDSYSLICDEARHVTASLQRILSLAKDDQDKSFSEDNEALVVAFESALYQLLTVRSHLQLPHDGAMLSTELTPSAIGVKLSKRDRDTIGVAFEGVIYRFYGATVVRQELLVLTPDALLFFRSQSSSPDKTVLCDRIIGVQATSVPYHSSSQCDFACAIQINTFAEEIVVCVATEHARTAWIRVLLQQSCPRANLDRSFQAPLLVCFTPTKPLKPANRMELNARSLFPHINSPNQDACAMVATALRSALRVHALGERADVLAILDFLNHASALRNIDLSLLLTRPHEERLAFFLNLYHVVLAHAMIAHGFPRTKAHWEDFQTHMCYVVGSDVVSSSQQQQAPLSLSLAEIEHVILRARLPLVSDVPHLRLSSLAPEFASRLTPLGIAHPDFRVSFALLMNQDRTGIENDVVVFHGDTIHEQLNAIVQTYVAQHVVVDTARQTIFLPRICEWFKHDFGGGGSPLYCVRKLLGFMDETMQHHALEVLDSATLVHIKYGAFHYVPRTTLRLASASSRTTVEEEAAKKEER